MDYKDFIGNLLRKKPKKIYSPIDGNWYNWNGMTLGKYKEENPYIFEMPFEGKSLCFKIWTNKHGMIYLLSFPPLELHRSRSMCRCCRQIQGYGFWNEEKNNQIPIRATYLSTEGYNYSAKRYCSYYDTCVWPSWGEIHGANEENPEIKLEFIIEF